MLEHEDHEMMRPLVVMLPQVIGCIRAVGAAKIAPTAERSTGWSMGLDRHRHEDTLEGMIRMT
jgi:hypothetical protein